MGDEKDFRLRTVTCSLHPFKCYFIEAIPHVINDRFHVPQNTLKLIMNERLQIWHDIQVIYSDLYVLTWLLLNILFNKFYQSSKMHKGSMDWGMETIKDIGTGIRNIFRVLVESSLFLTGKGLFAVLVYFSFIWQVCTCNYNNMHTVLQNANV